MLDMRQEHAAPPSDQGPCHDLGVRQGIGLCHGRNLSLCCGRGALQEYVLRLYDLALLSVPPERAAHGPAVSGRPGDSVPRNLFWSCSPFWNAPGETGRRREPGRRRHVDALSQDRQRPLLQHAA